MSTKLFKQPTSKKYPSKQGASEKFNQKAKSDPKKTTDRAEKQKERAEQRYQLKKFDKQQKKPDDSQPKKTRQSAIKAKNAKS